MLGIGKKDDQGRQVRIEHRGRHVRASRTGGVSLRAQAKAAGMNFTVNSSHGTRISRRVAKGTNVAFQRGRFRLRGRYGSGNTKVNLSKSGVSLSTRNKIGTINLTNPNRSSAKIAGVQVRGKKAAQIQTAYIIITGIFSVLQFAFALIVNMLIFALYAAEWLGRVMIAGAGMSANAVVRAYTYLGDSRSRRRHERLLAEIPVQKAIGETDTDTAEAVIVLVLTLQARGKRSLGPEDREVIETVYSRRHSFRSQPPAAERLEAIAETVEQTVTGDAPQSTRIRRQREEAIFVYAARMLAENREPDYLLSLLYLLDDLCMVLGERTRAQETLLDAYCEQSGISVAPDAEAQGGDSKYDTSSA